MAKVPLVGVWVDLRDQDCHSQHRMSECNLQDDVFEPCHVPSGSHVALMIY